MSFEHYIRSGTKQLRCGYTTGTCAALAAAGATEYLLSGVAPESMTLVTPKGWQVDVPILNAEIGDGYAVCAVKKDAGDDPDITDGILIYARAEKVIEGVSIDGGAGVGRVTKPGLDQNVGDAAINSTPRKMISDAVEAVCEEQGYCGGIKILISVPDGDKLAKKTFNPMLGIEGGISILGTSGVVEPMSEQALVDTIELEISQAAAENAQRLVLTPGNYGMDFLHSEFPRLAAIHTVKCSNFIGDAIDIAFSNGFSEIIIVGHVGKLVKIAGGVMNTHSKTADCRREIFCAHAAICGADTAVCRELMEQITTDACIDILERAKLKEKVMKSITGAISAQLEHRVRGEMKIGAVIFSNEHGLLGITSAAEELLKTW